jgi:hypothetical protein
MFGQGLEIAWSRYRLKLNGWNRILKPIPS